MTALAALLAFVETPAGGAILAAIPTLVTDVISIWTKAGVLNAQMVADYLSSAQAFDQLVPKKPGA